MEKQARAKLGTGIDWRQRRRPASEEDFFYASPTAFSLTVAEARVDLTRMLTERIAASEICRQKKEYEKEREGNDVFFLLLLFVRRDF